MAPAAAECFLSENRKTLIGDLSAFKKMAPAAKARLMSSFPEEILVEILLKLPAKSILSCKCVCKLWFNLISSPNFINDHLKLSIQNKKNHKIMFTDMDSDTGKPLIYSVDFASISSTPDLSCDYIGDKAVLMGSPFEYKEGVEVRMLGACDGLICFVIYMDKETKICIWNPTTREYKEMQHCDFPVLYYSRAGFGYDSKAGDYKIVRIVEDFEMSDYCEVEVYTLGSHLSKTIRTFTYKFPAPVKFHGVLLNGALHWISYTSKQDAYNYIASFDISSEKLMDVALPEKSVIYPEDGSNKKLYRKVGVLGDCLSLVLVDEDMVRAEVWVMQDYGVRQSWAKLFTTTQETITQYAYFWMPMLSLKNGDFLVYTYNGFVLYDPKNERVGKMSSFFQRNTVGLRALTMKMAHPESYVESLVSLNSGTYLKKIERS